MFKLLPLLLILISVGQSQAAVISSAVIVTGLGFTPENVANKDTDGTLSADSDTKYPSQKAVKTYVDAQVVGASVTSVSGTAPIVSSGGATPAISIPVATGLANGYLSAADHAAFSAKQNALGYVPEDVANKDTDGTLSANSDIKYASQKATKTYVDTGLAGKQATLIFFNEAPTGVPNDVLVTFTLPHVPANPASLNLTLDGLALQQGVDYTIAGAILTLTTAPATGQSFWAIYN